MARRKSEPKAHMSTKISKSIIAMLNSKGNARNTEGPALKYPIRLAMKKKVIHSEEMK